MVVSLSLSSLTLTFTDANDRSESTAWMPTIPTVIFVDHIRPFLSDDVVQNLIKDSVEANNLWALHYFVGTKATLPQYLYGSHSSREIMKIAFRKEDVELLTHLCKLGFGSTVAAFGFAASYGNLGIMKLLKGQ